MSPGLPSPTILKWWRGCKLNITLMHYFWNLHPYPHKLPSLEARNMRVNAYLKSPSLHHFSPRGESICLARKHHGIGAVPNRITSARWKSKNKNATLPMNAYLSRRFYKKYFKAYSIYTIKENQCNAPVQNLQWLQWRKRTNGGQGEIQATRQHLSQLTAPFPSHQTGNQHGGGICPNRFTLPVIIGCSKVHRSETSARVGTGASIMLSTSVIEISAWNATTVICRPRNMKDIHYIDWYCICLPILS